MALARVKTWIAGEVLTASDLNAEFNNLLNNSRDLISPLSASLDMNGFELILDANADTSITADTDDQIDIRIGGADDFQFTANTFSVLSGSILLLPNGTVGAPGLAFTNSTTSGLYRIGSNNIGFAIAGAKVLDLATTGLAVTGVLSCTGNAALGDAVGDSHTVSGDVTITDDSNAGLVVIRSGGGDRFAVGGSAAGSGGQLAITNGAATDYEPMVVVGETISLFARSGVLTAVEVIKVTNTALLFPLDNTYDIGASAATRPKDIFAAGALNAATVAGSMVATQAQQETGSATTVIVTPGRQQFHPSAAKGWGKINVTGSADASYNVTSVTDNGTGDALIVWNVDFSSSEHVTTATPFVAAAAQAIRVSSLAAGQDNVICFTTTTGAAVDPTCFLVTAFGDQ